MASFYIAPEASIPYKITGEDGTVAVLNDPADPNFVGYLNGEDALSGIDSPELRDSFAEMSETDGSWAGQSFYTRRPIVMNGKVIPVSAADRNAKLGRLMQACTARFADGTLSWTPSGSGGERVFLKFRTQLPFRAKGGFNKEFQIGLVANDPRIYSKRAWTRYIETNGESIDRDYRRFTWSSGSGTSIAARSLYLPPGTYTLKVPVKCSQIGRVLNLWTTEPAVELNGATADGSWQIISRKFVRTADEATATAYSIYLYVALTSGNYVEVGDPIIESAEGKFPSNAAGFAGGWSVQTGYTASWQTANPPNVLQTNHPGNAVSLPRTRFIGPGSHVALAVSASSYMRLIPNDAYVATDMRTVDWGFRTVINPVDGTSKYADVAQSNWRGILPDTNHDSLLFGFTGTTIASRMDMTWRGVWL